MDSITVGINNENNEIIEGEIRPLSLDRDTLKWFTTWYGKMCDLEGEPFYQDSNWNVPKIWEHFDNHPDFRVFILEINNIIQGYVIVRISNYIGQDKKNCGYIAFLASAPWNRKKKLEIQEFKEIGTTLIRLSIVLSTKYTKNPSIELSALSHAESFYRKLGFKNTGLLNEENLPIYKLSTEDALKLIRPMLKMLLKGGVWND